MSISGLEDGFSFITFLNSDLMVVTSQIQLGKILGLT